MEKVIEQIPNDMAHKVRDVFFELYREQLTSQKVVDLNEIFARFINPKETLSQSYSVELLDDIWFVEAVNHEETTRLSQKIKDVYKAKRGRPKGMRSAIHDALMLRWIQLEREKSNRNAWLVTLDTSLPNSTSVENSAYTSIRPLAITLDALLQWISPIAVHVEVEDEFAAIFSEAVKYQLLPQESFFDLKDFLVFAGMEISCKELPVEDVEACIRFLKIKASHLDPSRSTDREKIIHEISKFFADPGRKYKQEIQRLESEISKINDDNKRMLEEEQNKRRLDEIENKLKLENIERAIKERDARIDELERVRSEKEKEDKENDLKRSAFFRLRVIVLFIIFIEFVTMYFIWQYGEGTNFLQRLNNSWELLAATPSIGVVMAWFILGRKRIRRLGWPFTKILKGE